MILNSASVRVRVLIGGDVWFTLRGAEVASAPLRVTVSTPDGHEVSATFDLAALR